MASHIRVPSISRQLAKTYYVHHRANDENHPLADSLEHIRRSGALTRLAPIGPQVEPYRFKFGAMGSDTPHLADYHSFASAPLVSDKIKNALVTLDVKTFEFVPAQIEHGGQAFPYWVMHPLTELDVVDLPRSEIRLFHDGDYLNIKKMSLDEGKLSSIAVEERLFFRLKRRPSLFLWHCSLVHAVMAVQPSGIRFFDAEGYGQSMQFTP